MRTESNPAYIIMYSAGTGDSLYRQSICVGDKILSHCSGKSYLRSFVFPFLWESTPLRDLLQDPSGIPPETP
ncbi:hypothetical protein Pgin01_00290 [Porphyromonas gingivalis]